MSVVGIDPGSYNTVSHVAWLEGREFYLDAFQASREQLMPALPAFLSPLTHVAVDAPQGLPAADAEKPIRLCDRLANSPTRVLPRHRWQLQQWNLYRGLIEFGIDFFWRCFQEKGIVVFGLPVAEEGTVVCETYPRLLLKRQAGVRRIPSKRKAPALYAEMVMDFLTAMGYKTGNVIRPTPDQCDAMLCAVAADALQKAGSRMLPGTVGLAPIVDEEEQVIREGYIVCP